jgi:hypothetical protein
VLLELFWHLRPKPARTECSQGSKLSRTSGLRGVFGRQSYSQRSHMRPIQDFILGVLCDESVSGHRQTLYITPSKIHCSSPESCSNAFFAKMSRIDQHSGSFTSSLSPTRGKMAMPCSLEHNIRCKNRLSTLFPDISSETGVSPAKEQRSSGTDPGIGDLSVLSFGSRAKSNWAVSSFCNYNAAPAILKSDSASQAPH